MFVIENLHKSYPAAGAEVRAVDGISLDAGAGKLATGVTLVLRVKTLRVGKEFACHGQV